MQALSSFLRGLLFLLPLSAADIVERAIAQPVGDSVVSFPSRESAGRTVTLRGVLWLADSPKGAVVLVHGSGGWSDHREGHYGRALKAAGYSALAIDSFGPRGISETVDDQSRISATQMTVDAFAARRFLIEQGVPASRIALMGFSKGGSVALYAADRNFLPQVADRFAATIPFYPGCNVRPRTPKPAATVFMALAEKDDYTGVKPCEALAQEYEKAGGKIDVKIYSGASHAFDGDPARTQALFLRSAENYVNCIVYLEDDGSMTYADKRYAEADPSLFADVRKTCMRKGASIWTNARQKQAATRDVIEFLGRVFP